MGSLITDAFFSYMSVTIRADWLLLPCWQSLQCQCCAHSAPEWAFGKHVKYNSRIPL